MANTGMKGWSTLEEYYIDTGLPTGFTKPNVPGDPDYVPPVSDPAFCPPATITPPATGISMTLVNTGPFNITYNGPATGTLTGGGTVNNLPVGNYTFSGAGGTIGSNQDITEYIFTKNGTPTTVSIAGLSSYSVNLAANDILTIEFVIETITP